MKDNKDPTHKGEDKHNEDHVHNENFDGFSLEELDEQFTSLASELKTKGVKVDSIMEVNQRMEASVPHFRDYDPTVLDFLERANTDEECKEVIAYSLKKGDINQEEATNLLERLKQGGPSVFGKRKSGYYDGKLT